MNNFTFHVPTDIRFGKGQVECLPEELKKYGSTVLLVYGGGSIKRTGLYDTITKLLAEFQIVELPGIEPNPKLSMVRKGVKLCREHKVDAILAVGGGSCIDTAKHIACSVFYDKDPWDLMIDRTKMTEALPIAVVLTICAAGSEMNSGAVITNEETSEKLEINGPILYPAISVCDPTLLYTLPSLQTAYGTVDIMSHVMEQYFQPNDGACLTDLFSESVLKTCIKYGPVALREPENYEARSNLMWAGSVGLNHLLSVGKGGAWSVHPMEHVVSAYYDITHAAGLAVLTPAWMRYVLCERTVDRFAMYAENVWNIKADDRFDAAKEGIRRTEQFFRELGMPARLSEVGIDESRFNEMAADVVRTSKISTGAYFNLDKEDIERIFRSVQ